MSYSLKPFLVERIKRKLKPTENNLNLNAYQVVLQFFEAHNHKNIEGLSIVFAENAQFFAPFLETPLVNREEIKQLYLQAFKEMADRVMKITNLVYLDNNVAVEWKLQGTNSNGKKIQINEAGFFEVKKGMIQQMRLYVDMTTVFKQYNAS